MRRDMPPATRIPGVAAAPTRSRSIADARAACYASSTLAPAAMERLMAVHVRALAEIGLDCLFPPRCLSPGCSRRGAWVCAPCTAGAPPCLTAAARSAAMPSWPPVHAPAALRLVAGAALSARLPSISPWRPGCMRRRSRTGSMPSSTIAAAASPTWRVNTPPLSCDRTSARTSIGRSSSRSRPMPRGAQNVESTCRRGWQRWWRRRSGCPPTSMRSSAFVRHRPKSVRRAPRGSPTCWTQSRRAGPCASSTWSSSTTS